MLTDAERIYLAALTQTRKRNRDWNNGRYKLWSLATGSQPIGKARLSLEIRQAVLREITNRPYTPRQEAKPVLQNQANVLPSKSRPKLRSVKPCSERVKPTKIKRIRPRQVRPAAVKA